MLHARAGLLAVLVSASVSGCLGFGGPLLAETDDGSVETESESETGPPPSECGPTQAVVERVIDGDTIVLASGEHVRYILVNTPEITAGKNECYGTQGRDFNDMMVTGKTVTLEYDQECQDIYGRLLAYVSVDDVELNRALLEQGYACILHVSPNGDDRFAEYQTLEDTARADGIGMWSACGTVACDW